MLSHSVHITNVLHSKFSLNLKFRFLSNLQFYTFFVKMDHDVNEYEEFSREMSPTKEKAIHDLDEIYQELELLKAQVMTKRIQKDSERVANQLQKTQELNKRCEGMLNEAQLRLARTAAQIADFESRNQGDIKDTTEAEESQETADSSEEQPIDTNTNTKSVVSATDIDTSSSSTSTVIDTSASATDILLTPLN